MKRIKDVYIVDANGEVLSDAVAYLSHTDSPLSEKEKNFYLNSGGNTDKLYNVIYVRKYNHKIIKERESLQKQIQRRSENYPYTRYFKVPMNLKPQNLTKIFYLATFLTRQENYICLENNWHSDKMQIKDLLQLSKKGFFNFWKEATDSNIIVEDEYGVMLNSDIFTRQSGITEVSMVRCFPAVKELYETISVSQHKVVGYIFKMLPYLNSFHNIVCRNPDEHNINRIRPVTNEELCAIIEYDYSHVTRLIKALSDVTIFDRVHVFFNRYDKRYNQNITLLSPLLFFGGEWIKKDDVTNFVED